MKARRLLTPLLVLSCAMVLAAISRTTSDGSSVSFETHKVRSAVVNVITADLNDPRVRVEVGLPEKGISHSEPFLRMVRRHAPVAAVTGTYFDTRTLFPVGSIIIKGKTTYESAIGTAVCFIKPQGFFCVPNGKLAQAAEQVAYRVRFALTAKGERFSWRGVDTGFRTGPLLLKDGVYSLNPRREGFREPGLFGARTRIALGLTGQNKLLLVAVDAPTTFGGLAGIMKALGAVDAVAMDGGTSSAMYYRGRFVRYPGRALTNIVELYEANPILDQPAYTPGVMRYAQQAHQQLNGVVASPCIARQAVDHPISRLSVFSLSLPFTAAVNYAVIPTPVLTASKSRHARFPVHRAKLAGLKGFDHANHFVHIATYVEVMHHLVA